MKYFKKYKEIIMYIVFGVATTLVNWAIYSVGIKLLPDHMTTCNGIAWIVAVVFAFITNKLFVFESKSKDLKIVLKEFFSFVFSRGFTGLIEIFLPTVLFNFGFNQSLLNIKGFWAKASVSIIVIVLNYIFSKLIVFKKNK